MAQDAPENTPTSPITGYVARDQASVDTINRVKEIERQLAEVYSGVQRFLANTHAIHTAEATVKNNELTSDSREVANQRHADTNYIHLRHWESIAQMRNARTAFEQGFMHMTRAIAQPHSPWIDERNRKAPEPSAPPEPFPPRP